VNCPTRLLLKIKTLNVYAVYYSHTAIAEGESEQIRNILNDVDVMRTDRFPLFDDIVDRHFEVVFFGSVAEDLWGSWLAEAFRMLKPGGHLVLTGQDASDILRSNLVEAGFECDDASGSSSSTASEEMLVYRRPQATSPSVPARSILRTERLYMRPWTREDLDLEDAWHDFDDPIYRHYNPRRDPPDKRDIRFQKIAALFDLKLAIFDEDGLTGYIALFGTDHEKLDSEMGINFAAHRCGRGYCKESLTRLCDEFFLHWGMQRMRLEVAVFNEFGIRCYERCGFREVRRFWNPRAPQRLYYQEGDPEYAHVARHFRRGENGYEVEFMEMAVTKDEYKQKFHN